MESIYDIFHYRNDNCFSNDVHNKKIGGKKS